MKFNGFPFKHFTIAVLTFWGLTACSPPTQTVQEVFYVFGTEVRVEIVDAPQAKAEHAIQGIEATFQQFNQDWHAWEKGGILGNINDAIAAREPITLADSVKHFILKSQTLAAESDYLFDPGIGQLIELWGFHSEDWHGPPPSEETLQAWLKSRPSIRDIYFKDNALYSRNPNVRLDFGGNAKGLALDLAIESLLHAGIQNAIVNIGGDMRIIGSKTRKTTRPGASASRPGPPEHRLGELANQRRRKHRHVRHLSALFHLERQALQPHHQPEYRLPADHFIPSRWCTRMRPPPMPLPPP